MLGDFAPFVSLILAIFVFALAAKAPAVGFPALIAVLIYALTHESSDPLRAGPVAHSFLLIGAMLGPALISFLFAPWIVEMEV